MVISFARMDFIPFSLYVEGKNLVIDAPFYGTEFALDEIESVKLDKALPSGSVAKTNGAGTKQYLFGNFRQEGTGDCKIYYYSGYSPVIHIDLAQECII